MCCSSNLRVRIEERAGVSAWTLLSAVFRWMTHRRVGLLDALFIDGGEAVDVGFWRGRRRVGKPALLHKNVRTAASHRFLFLALCNS